MTIIHVDTANAASISNPATELSLPSPGFQAFGSSSPWSAWAVIVIFGDTNDVLEGTYLEEESPSYSNSGTWLADTSDTSHWMARFVNGSEYGGGAAGPLSLRYGGGWLNGQSDWRAFGNHWGWTNLSYSTSWSWGAGWSYGGSGEGTFATIEFAKGATGLLETATNANVSTGLDTITITGHGFSSGDAVLFTTTGTPPSPLVSNGLYYVSVVDGNTIKLGTGMVNIDSTPSFINLTTTGSGTFNFRRVEAHGSCSFFIEAND